jgi:hypothetical protein
MSSKVLGSKFEVRSSQMRETGQVGSKECGEVVERLFLRNDWVTRKE